MQDKTVQTVYFQKISMQFTVWVPDKGSPATFVCPLAARGMFRLILRSRNNPPTSEDNDPEGRD